MQSETTSFFLSLFLPILNLLLYILHFPSQPQRHTNPKSRLLNALLSFINFIMHAQAPLLTLEVTVLSADNLRVDRTSLINNVYVVVRAESINSFATGMVSATSSQFLWNDKFLVDMEAHTRSITFEVKHKTAMGVVKNVGVARIAVSDLLGGGGSGMAESCSKVLTYRLRDGEGGPNGVINFAVKILMECSSSSTTKPVAVMTEKKVSSCGFQMRASMADQMKLNGVVIGVPTCWNPCTRRYS